MRQISMRSSVALLTVLAWLAPAPAGAACSLSALGPDAPAALVLSGGGAKGAYEAGVALALAARGVPIRLAAGSRRARSMPPRSPTAVWTISRRCGAAPRASRSTRSGPACSSRASCRAG